MHLALSDNYMKNGQMLPVDGTAERPTDRIRLGSQKKNPLKTQLPSKAINHKLILKYYRLITHIQEAQSQGRG